MSDFWGFPNVYTDPRVSRVRVERDRVGVRVEVTRERYQNCPQACG